LATVEYLCSRKVLKVLVIAKHLDLIRCSFAVSAPVLEGIDNGQKFLVMAFVVDFRQLELTGVEGHRL